MRRLVVQSLVAPVGLSLLLVGFSIAVLVARSFVALEAHCTQSCAIVRPEGIQIHHFYYGVALALVSLVILSFTKSLWTRWDSALLFGMGLGLISDEAGMILWRIDYRAPGSIATIMAVAGILVLAALYSFRSRGLHEFNLLDRSDVLTVMSVLLGVAGFLYFVRPITTLVTVVSYATWGSAVLLMAVYGRRHLLKILRGRPLVHRLK